MLHLQAAVPGAALFLRPALPDLRRPQLPETQRKGPPPPRYRTTRREEYPTKAGPVSEPEEQAKLAILYVQGLLVELGTRLRRATLPIRGD